ncbi:putative transposase [Shigella flexneri 2a str. 2457T]|nr:putative transposase [Shigella flexneri 2a str. 2457T]
MTKELTGKALFMALRSQRPPAGLIHHSDRGSQYCAYDYRVIQEQFGLKTSMSRKVTVTTTLRWKASGER